MSSSLYVFLDSAQPDASLVPLVSGLRPSGFTLFESPLKWSIQAPGEPDAAVRLAFYGHQYFRIFVSDRAVLFYRGRMPAPQEIVAGEREFRDALLGFQPFELRRWILTREGWDDADVVAEGTDVLTLASVFEDRRL
jgi:hypothetical protein